MTQRIGCGTDNGPAGEPDARPFIERFFQLLSRHFAHRLPGALGSDPESIEKALGEPGSDLSLLIELGELEQLIEVLLANYNGQTHGGVLGLTPLEPMRHSLRRPPRVLRTLPRFLHSSLCLLQESRVVSVVGSLRKGVRAHINFANVKYTSKELASSAVLIGKTIRIYYDVRDIRTVKAYFEDGAELGILTAARPWNATPHSLRLRQEIFRLIAEGKLSVKEGQEPIEAWEKMRWRDARTNKRAANALAQARSNGTIGDNIKVTTSQATSSSAPELAVPSAPPTIPSVPATVPDTSAPVVEPDPKTAPKSSLPEEAPIAQPRPLKIRRTVTF